MYLESRCCDITEEKWRVLMNNIRPCSYRLLVAKIKKKLPDLYHSLRLDIRNPYAHEAGATKTHYVLVHSAVEYFIRR